MAALYALELISGAWHSVGQSLAPTLTSDSQLLARKKKQLACDVKNVMLV